MSVLANIAKIPELRRRILYTVGMLAVYRLGIFVTTPGVNREALRQQFASGGGLLGMFNLFSGGALENSSIFALNIMPYVTASIIIQLLTVVIKPLEELRKEGEAGQRKINQYTRYGTIGISILQGYFIAKTFEGYNAGPGPDPVASPGIGFQLLTVLALTTGTAFLMWVGEQITEKGIGNGISLIIFAGIVANMPDAGRMLLEQVKLGELRATSLLAIVGIAFILTAIIVFVERAQRQIPITHAKRVQNRQVYGGQTSHLPLKVNLSGVIPPIFASSILTFPATLQGLEVPGADWLNAQLGQQWVYMTVFGSLCVFFTFFYVAITFQPVEVAENLKKQNAFIPGVRPGKATAEHIEAVVGRLTTGGAIYLAFVCLVPTLIQGGFNLSNFYLGGTSLIIVVGVAIDLAQQVEGHLITRHYEGLTAGRGEVISGRKGTA